MDKKEIFRNFNNLCYGLYLISVAKQGVNYLEVYEFIEQLIFSMSINLFFDLTDAEIELLHKINASYKARSEEVINNA